MKAERTWMEIKVMTRCPNCKCLLISKGDGIFSIPCGKSDIFMIPVGGKVQTRIVSGLDSLQRTVSPFFKMIQLLFFNNKYIFS